MKSRTTPSDLPQGVHRHLAAALKAGFKRYRKKLRQCRRRFSDENVHELRVEIRRLLSSTELIGVFVHQNLVKKARRLLKKNLEAFGGLRDVHVQLLAVEKLARRLAGARAFHAHLCDQEKRLIDDTRRNIRCLKPKRLGEIVGIFRADLRRRRKSGLDRTDSAHVFRAVERAFEHVLRLKEQIDPAQTETIHRTRIAFKKFRYMVEALAPLRPEISHRKLAAMHEYQGTMGEIQDAEVLLASFDRFVRLRSSFSPSVTRVHTALRQRRELQIERFLRTADRLHDFWPETAPDANALGSPKEATSHEHLHTPPRHRRQGQHPGPANGSPPPSHAQRPKEDAGHRQSHAMDGSVLRLDRIQPVSAGRADR